MKKETALRKLTEKASKLFTASDLLTKRRNATWGWPHLFSVKNREKGAQIEELRLARGHRMGIAQLFPGGGIPLNRRHLRKSAIRVIGAWLPFALPYAVLVSACTNNFMKDPSSFDGNALKTAVANPNNTGSSLVISRVAKSAVTPESAFDVIGDGSGAMAEYCFSENGSSIGASNCKCDYRYILPDGSENGFSVDTTYHDANMIRCPFVGTQSIPSSASSINLRVVMQNSGSESNIIQVKMSGTGVALDLSDPLSFIQVQRYQCRDVAVVPYLFQPGSSGIVDPVLSDSPKITYPLNFYTTNMGGTLARFASLNPQSASLWNCPHIPNDGSRDAGLELTVYSLGPDSSGSKQIFPPKGGFDRSTFQLARSATGIFNVPMNAIIAPTLASGTVASGQEVPPLGYAAARQGESCPDTDPSVSIPDGYEWVKVWLFRANLAPREFRRSVALNTAGAIACNPGKWPGTNNDIFPDCAGIASMTDLLNPTGRPAGRVIWGTSQGTQLCANLRGPFSPCNGDGPGCTTDLDGETLFPEVSQFAPGSDIWHKSANATPASCGGSNNVDPFKLCSGDANPVPHTEELTTGNIDTQGERYDFLFVVTPPTVTTETMKNLASSASHAYIPYRYRPGDCNSPDPENPVTPGDCDGSKRITYGLKLHDVVSNGDPPAGNPNRTGVFPVCTIRPRGN